MKYEVKLVPITNENDLAEHRQVTYLPQPDGTYKPCKIIIVSKNGGCLGCR